MAGDGQSTAAIGEAWDLFELGPARVLWLTEIYIRANAVKKKIILGGSDFDERNHIFRRIKMKGWRKRRHYLVHTGEHGRGQGREHCGERHVQAGVVGAAGDLSHSCGI